VKILNIGLLMTACGVAAGIAGMCLGAGPCNATSAGIILLILGFAAAPVGAITAIIGLVIELRKTPASS